MPLQWQCNVNIEIDTKRLRLRLLEILKEKSLMFGDFKLSSGMRSDYYIDGKKTTLDPEGLYLIAEIILDMIKDDKAAVIGGLTLGADSIVGAVTSLSFLKAEEVRLRAEEGHSPQPSAFRLPPINGFIVRKEPKGHGTGNKIEGVLEKGSRVVIVEDVVTTGDSIAKAIDTVKELGCTVARIISIVDRKQGAKERFEQAGLIYSPIFTLTDLGVHH